MAVVWTEAWPLGSIATARARLPALDGDRGRPAGRLVCRDDRGLNHGYVGSSSRAFDQGSEGVQGRNAREKLVR